jgi:aromatic ring-cleaving dioxygenase
VPYYYDPNTSGLTPEGSHQLTIVAVEERVSRNGNDMWLVRFHDPANREIVEWIVLDDRGIDWKLKPLWQAAGLPWLEKAGVLDETLLVDKTVRATIHHEKSGEFGTQARISGYVTQQSDLGDDQAQQFFAPETTYGKAPGNAVTADVTDDEDIPFLHVEPPEWHDRYRTGA